MRDDIIRDSTLKDSSILIPEALKLYKALDIQTVSPITKVAMADFMMIVNSYYSNLIEDIIVNPLEIEKYEKTEDDKSNNEGVALNKPERTTRDITKKLIINNLLKSVTPKSSLRLNLPVKYGAMLFPGIFPYSLERDIIESD